MAEHHYLIMYCLHKTTVRIPLRNIKLLNIIAHNEVDVIRKFVELSSENPHIRRFIYQYLIHNSSNSTIVRRLINVSFTDEIEFNFLVQKFIDKHFEDIIEILRNADDETFHVTELSHPIYAYTPPKLSRFLRNEYLF